MTWFGPDGSHWQREMLVEEIDWARVKFLIWRASIGSNIDMTYSTWRNAAKAHHKPFMAYHFVYQTEPVPGTTHPGIPASVQAETFARAEPDVTIPVMLDWEERKLTTGGVTVVTQATFQHVQQVAWALHALGYETPLLYTGEWYWKAQGEPIISGNGFELVNANYGKGNNVATSFEFPARYAGLGGDVSTLWQGYGGLSPVMWQFSDRVRWSTSPMDMNAVRDTTMIARNFKEWTTVATTTPTYPYGYSGTMLTMADMERRTTVKKLHPEFWRRYKALMVAAYKAGVRLGVGTGWRVQPNPPPPGFAAPGNSNHEGFPADGESGGAVAIDTVPAASWVWMESHLKAYGLRSFNRPSTWGYTGTDEPWHIQPVEIPASRRWRKTPWTLPTFKLPGTPAPPPLIVDAPPPTMSLGVVSPNIMWLQTILHQRFGVFPSIDGVFGPATESGVIHMQDILRNSGYDVGNSDGVYGPRTASALASWLSKH